MSTRTSLATESDWLDIRQAEHVYPYSRRQFWYWITAGYLTAYRPTKRKIILRRSDIDTFLESKRIGGELVDEGTAEALR